MVGRTARFRVGVWLVLLLGAALAGGAALAARARQSEPAPAAPVVPPAPPTGVGALGRLEPGWKVYQIAPATSADGARVEELSAEEGDEVAAGGVLAVLDTAPRRGAALKEAEAQALVARAKLAQVRAGPKAEDVAAQTALVGKFRASVAHAETMLKRAEALRATGVSSADDADLRKMEAETNRELFKQAEATLAAMKVVRPEEVAVAEAEVAKAEAGVARAAAELEATRVRAPIAGRVLKVYARRGERVGENGLLDIGETGTMHAVAEVYERDVPRVRAGQRATVRVQSLEGELSGVVEHVGWKVGRQVVFDNDPVRDTDARVVEVRVKLDSAASARVARLSFARVEVRVHTAEGR